MILVVDIGNTNLTFGIYKEDELVSTFRLATDKNLSSEEYCKNISNLTEDYLISGCIIGSVVDELSEKIKQICDKLFGINTLLLDGNLKLNIKTGKNKSTIGADRLANASSAYNRYKAPVIVIDLGSANTFDIVSREGVFVGGVIMPGLKMQLKALRENTSKLPEIEIKHSETAIGTDTESSILSGVIRGTACAIEGLIKQCERELGEKPTIVLTGGSSKIISQYLESVDYINQNLTLDGLKDIYKMNADFVKT